MFIYFIAALLISTTIFKLGVYWTIIHLMVSASKVVVALLMVAALFLLHRKLVISRSIKLKVLPSQK